ncbi:MAG: head GIN domain-containing protein [Leeuwenhoekiella sp.]
MKIIFSKIVINFLKNLICLFLVGLLTGCNSENANDCIQASGDIIDQEFPVEEFTRIRTENDVILILKEGAEHKVIITSGKNLLNDIEVKVENGILILQNHNSCNLVRDYGITSATVTAPNIVEIRNSSAGAVTSEGQLTYPRLILTSNTSLAGVENIHKSGDFKLNIACDTLSIRANGKGLFEISGTASKLDVTFDDEAPRLEAQDLIADEVQIFHRGANKMIVNPQKSIHGTITGTGDVISVNRPPIVEVEELYTGRLIFQD